MIEYFGEWHENENGNWVLLHYDHVVATVYAAGDSWSAVWNGASDGEPRRLKAKLDSAAAACRAVEIAIAEGERSGRWWPPDEQWKPTRQGGYYRQVNGIIVSVKRAKSGSWYVTNGQAFLGQHGGTKWFPTPEEARSAVNTFANGSSNWSWVRPM